jgi:mRNA interferase RelE/StbE
MLKLEITKQALKFLGGLDSKQYRQVGSSVFALLGNPEPHDSIALKGAKQGERRLDIGEYRIVYAHNDDLLSVLVIGKRNDGEVYKVWERGR